MTDYGELVGTCSTTVAVTGNQAPSCDIDFFTEGLVELALKNDATGIKLKLQEMVPEYQPQIEGVSLQEKERLIHFEEAKQRKIAGGLPN